MNLKNSTNCQFKRFQGKYSPNYFVTISTIVVLLFIISSCGKNKSKEKTPEIVNPEEENYVIRKAAVAGKFYPEDVPTLKDSITKFLNSVPPKKITEEMMGLIVPHAGYDYSGQVAAFAYAQIRNKKIDTVILIGPSHFVEINGSSIWDKGYFETPLGLVPVDEELASLILKENYPSLIKEEKAHIYEHSLEVQLPYLQMVLSNFKIVPIVMGIPSRENCEQLAEVLYKVIKSSAKKILIIASSDLSHFHPYEVARKMDLNALKSISSFDIEGLIEKLKREEVELCGAGPVITTLIVTKKLGADKTVLLNYANSGDVTGKQDKVVGYASVVILKSTKKKVKEMEEEFKLSKDEKKKLLNIARQTITEYLRNKKVINFKVEDANLQTVCGAFVTLKKRGELRGCIGNLKGDKPLYKMVQDMSIASATQDPRFPPVKLDELKEIEIEISVLSPLRKVKNPEEVKVGIHGVFIKKGIHSGVFLPQVATEQGWNREEFLTYLCTHKAGLPPDAWKKDAEIHVFTALVFGEKEV